MADKEVNIEIDFKSLAKKSTAEEELVLAEPSPKKVGVRSTLIALGKDPRVATEPTITAPDLYLLEILKDGFKNPYVEVNWKIARSDVDRVGVVGFNIFRRKVDAKKFNKNNRRRGLSQQRFSTVGFARLSRGISRRGKFSPEQKALYQVDRSVIPPASVNFMASELQSAAKSRAQNSLNLLPSFSRFENPYDGNQPVLNTARFTQYFNDKRFVKVGFVSYESFLAKDKSRFVSVKEREFVDLSFKDKSVVYGRGYEYYVTSVPKDVQQSVQSNAVEIFIEDVSPVRSPKQVFSKLIRPTQIRVSVLLDARDDVGRVFVYKRSESEVFFEKIAVFENINDCVDFVDSNIIYGSRYFYRIFAESIHGVLSEPREVSVDSFSQNVLSRGRSNNFKNPILNVIQDQNSDNLKISIAANDSKVAYYELTRRDLTIHEKKFQVPGPETTNFGGRGWDTNKFFVQRKRKLLNTKLENDKELFNRKTINSEITFVDDIVQKDHVYEYRIQGKDLFGNASSYALAVVKAKGKQPVRTPVNVRIDILRSHPFRLKFSWQNDNELTLFSREELFEVESPTEPDDVKFLYHVQRRKEGETRYESFPITANDFLIDEIASRDAVPLMQKKTDDIFTRLPNISDFTTTTGITRKVGSEESVDQTPGVYEFKDPVVRPFQTPAYLESNDVYYYRVAAIRKINDEDEQTNFSAEFKVYSTSKLADPENFKVEVPNLRVSPRTAVLTWTTKNTDTRPDRWIIERKFDVETDTFEPLGAAYLEEKFFDKDVKLGNSYIYRIKSIDNFGRESEFFEARLTV